MTYRATATIYAGPGVRAYNVGDVVPDSAVENLGIKGKVAKEGTKAAAKATTAPKDAAPSA